MRILLMEDDQLLGDSVSQALGAEAESNTVEVYVSRLRKRIGHERIETLRGVGYRLTGEPRRVVVVALLLGHVPRVLSMRCSR